MEGTRNKGRPVSRAQFFEGLCFKSMLKLSYEKHISIVCWVSVKRILVELFFIFFNSCQKDLSLGERPLDLILKTSHKGIKPIFQPFESSMLTSIRQRCGIQNLFNIIMSTLCYHCSVSSNLLSTLCLDMVVFVFMFAFMTMRVFLYYYCLYLKSKGRITFCPTKEKSTF